MSKAACSLLVLTAALATAAKHPQGDLRLSGLDVLYVEGNSEAAASVRRELLKRQSKYEKQACFHLSNKVSTALGLLKVEEHETTRSLLGVGQGDQVTVVTATLEDADSLLWSDAKQGAPGLIHTGAGDAVLHILHSLWKAAGCNGDGKKTESK